MSNCVEIGQTAAKIWRFFDFLKWRPPLSCIFKNFKFLTVGQLKWVEVRRHAKFGCNQSKRGQDMPIFRFFKTADAAILNF